MKIIKTDKNYIIEINPTELFVFDKIASLKIYSIVGNTV
jgi:hypothetical protein